MQSLIKISAVFLMVCHKCQVSKYYFKEFFLTNVLIQFFQSLRCRTDNGPSEESIKKTIRICMHKVGENETNDEYSYEDNSNSEQYIDEMTTRIPNNPSYSNGYSNSGKFNPYANSNGNTNNGAYDNPYNNWNASTSLGGMGIQRDYSIQFQNQYPSYSNSFNSNRTSANQNRTEQDRACLVHCFFHELKMVTIKSDRIFTSL